MKKLIEEPALAFGFATHSLTMMGDALSFLWPDKKFRPCMNALELACLKDGRTGSGGMLLNLSREFHELDSAFRLASLLSIPVIGAVAVDFVNSYSLALCLEKELPAVIGELKDRTELLEARESLAAGRRYVSRSLLKNEGFRFVDFPAGFDLLSDKEALCVDGRLGGLSSKEISALLNINLSSVRTHVNRAFRKLGVESGEELVWRLAGRPAGIACYQRQRNRRFFPAGRPFPRDRGLEAAERWHRTERCLG